MPESMVQEGVEAIKASQGDVQRNKLEKNCEFTVSLSDLPDLYALGPSDCTQPLNIEALCQKSKNKT